MDYENASAETPDDIEVNEPGVVRRWLLELKLADKREADWRKKSEAVWKRYRQKDAKRHSFNILWSNTETLRPAVYNSLPSPDVRRRFKDSDPLGKAASDVLARAIEYGLDTTDFDAQIKETVLDLLLPGRGVARVRYVPSLRQVGVTAETHDEELEQHAEGEESLEGQAEELEWEQCPIEHVQWDDFRISAGKEWSEVCWIAFRHRLTREELEEQFGEIGEVVPLDNTDDDDVKAEQNEDVKDAFKTAEVWEIWDKSKRQVIFVCKSYKDKPLKTLDDPLKLSGFWPIPRPLYAVEDSASLIPTPLYELYKEQADELDSVTRRINLLVKGLKYRGIYDSTLGELAELMRGEDNDLIPAANVTALLERGGLEKAIWFMPIEQAARVLQVLQLQREASKQIIYEITGISDILRGSSVASETATAQQIKANWGSMRVKRMQSDVARFIRDLIRIQAEIIGERFQPETLATMTGLKFPTDEEKQAAGQQWLMAAQQAQMAGQQPPPEPNMPPSWGEVMGVIRDDKLRTFKVDVETDSTVAASVESDMQGLREVLTAVTQLVQGFGPAVQMGAMPIEAVKELILTVTRRAKMGNAVEDALDKIQEPKPQAQAQEKPDNAPEIEQMRQQGEMQRKQMEFQHAAQMEQVRQAAESQREELRLSFEKYKAELEAQTRVEVAQLSANATLQQAQISAAVQAANAQDTEVTE